MKINDPVRWNIRASFVYAVGTWTLIGAMGLQYYFRQNTEEIVEEKKVPDQNPNQRRVVIEKPNSRAVLTYREDNFVFTTWLVGLFKNITGGPRDE